MLYQIKLADGTTLDVLSISAGMVSLQGGYRDTLDIVLDKDSYTFDQLLALFIDTSKTSDLTILKEEPNGQGGSQISEFGYEGYSVFGGIALKEDGSFHVLLGQVIVKRELELMAQLEEAQKTVQILYEGAEA